MISVEDFLETKNLRDDVSIKEVEDLIEQYLIQFKLDIGKRIEYSLSLLTNMEPQNRREMTATARQVLRQVLLILNTKID